jgi:hypothetical protein
MMNRKMMMAGILALCLSLAACENAQKTAAQAALDLAQKTVDTFSASDAAKYLPAQAKDVQSTFQAAKDAFAKGDYTGALESAKSLSGKVKNAMDAWSTKKQEWTAKFNELNEKMPGMSAAVQTKIDSLRKSHKLPAGVADNYAQFKTTWADASAAFKSGDFSTAMAKAGAAQGQLASVQTALLTNN